MTKAGLRLAALCTFAVCSASRAATGGLEGMPAYDHVVIIEMENRQYGQIIDASPATSPHMTALAHRYNSATRFYGTTHVSQPNYIAMMAGDQHGVVDDDPWYCEADGSKLARDRAIVAGKPDDADMSPGCHPERASGHYVAHHFPGDSLFGQLDRAGISWAMYSQSMPVDPDGTPRPEIPMWPLKSANPDLYSLYASKHNPSVNFDAVRTAPDFRAHNRTDAQFFDDASRGTLPRFSYVVPDLCHDDHGARGTLTHAPECVSTNAGPSPLLTTGDNYVQKIVDAVRASPLWRSSQNVAVVITYDEDDTGSAGVQGCCGYQPVAPGGSRFGAINQGGGQIPTIVITNHGVTGVQDATPYNHYALLRTLEDTFGISDHLGHAALNPAVQPADGSFRQTPVLPMVPVFRLAPHAVTN